MTKPTITYELAMAAGRDAGNRSMRRAGRERWSEEDWNAAAETFARLWPEPTDNSKGGATNERYKENH